MEIYFENWPLWQVLWSRVTNALSDLSWTAVLARAEPCVENRTVSIFYENRSTPNVNKLSSSEQGKGVVSLQN